MPIKGKKTKNPSFFSHEFVIQNHADIVAVIATVFVAGLMIESLQPISSAFIAPQHNVTTNETEDVPTQTFYRAGPKDLLAVFFYTLLMILFHAMIQEFVLDKFNKKLHLSKVKFSKFNESGQLFAFYIFSFTYSANLIAEYVMAESHLSQFVSGFWLGYPEIHSMMRWHIKLFYILQISYWVHVFPELYLQKTKKEDMPAKIQLAVLYLVSILAGYIMSYHRVMLVLLCLHYLVEAVFHVARILYFLDKPEVANVLFGIWSVLFAVARVASVVLSVLTFWFGFGRVHSETQSFTTSIPIRSLDHLIFSEDVDGQSTFKNGTTHPCAFNRAASTAAVCCLQFWMMWNFITFKMRRGKQTSSQTEVPSKKVAKSANGVASKKKN